MEKYVSKESMWEKIEDSLEYLIPWHLKFIFELLEINTPFELIRINADNIQEMENYVRSTAYSSNIPKNELDNINKYYGQSSPDDFRFSDNDLSILKEILQLATEKPLTYWTKLDSQQSCLTSSSGNSFSQKNVEIYKELRNLSESTLMALIYKHAIENFNIKDQGKRYDYIFKLISSYYYMLGGRIVYDSLSKNLSLPSVATMKKFIGKDLLPIAEGCLRANQLKNYLVDRKYPLKVLISEDVTKINSRVQYDSKSNQIVGLVLPMNSNSMLVSYSFKATSASIMENHIKNNPVSSVLYTILAQPITKDAASFCVNIYGTDNCFNFTDVQKRQKYIKDVLEVNVQF